MSEELNSAEHLLKKLDELRTKQELFHKEIRQMEAEIMKLRKSTEPEPAEKSVTEPVKTEIRETVNEPEKQVQTFGEPPAEPRKKTEILQSKTEQDEEKRKSNLERFIGENLINKIGIAVTIIGVAIGAKYAIDHKLISPITRIILGYLVGFGLLFFALRLKRQYENFSAVLLSGSMAIMYFITYAAYSFFGLYPQIVTFILMVVFTVFTVTAALRYNREVIAIVGLVGAYAVPFLLSEGSGKVVILFSYIVIINIGILFISVKKYWKTLYISAFILSWLILFSWYMGSYKAGTHFTLALVFLFLFFIIFYLTFLSYKIIRKEKFNVFDIVLLLANSFIFYGIGYSILRDHQPGENLLGLYTVGNALIHLIVSVVIYRNKLADRNLFYLVSGLVIVFITIAIPVQLSGNWVTLLWIGEAALLFYIGRTRSAPVYEFIAYPLIILSFISISQDWINVFTDSTSKTDLHAYTPFLNIRFLNSVIFIAALSFVLVLYFSKKHKDPFAINRPLQQYINWALPALFILVVYIAFRSEISAYWNHLLTASETEVVLENGAIQSKVDFDLKYSRMIWMNCYSLLFFAVIAFVNIRYFKNQIAGIINYWINMFLTLFFLIIILYVLSELRESYLKNYLGEYFHRSSFNLFIRYVSFVFTAISLCSTSLWIRSEKVQENYRIIFSLLFHLTVLWVLSSELLNIMDLLKNTTSYKFGLSILFAVYALLLFVLGIAGKKKHLRIAGMALFGMTLAKLFFYDITRLDTILKTVLFLSIGVLMLIVSFLYIKYKKHLFGESEE